MRVQEKIQHKSLTIDTACKDSKTYSFMKSNQPMTIWFEKKKVFFLFPLLHSIFILAENHQYENKHCTRFINLSTFSALITVTENQQWKMFCVLELEAVYSYVWVSDETLTTLYITQY